MLSWYWVIVAFVIGVMCAGGMWWLFRVQAVENADHDCCGAPEGAWRRKK